MNATNIAPIKPEWIDYDQSLDVTNRVLISICRTIGNGRPMGLHR